MGFGFAGKVLQNLRGGFCAQGRKLPGLSLVHLDGFVADLPVARARNESGESVVVLLIDRVEHVIMAPGTCDGEPKEGFAKHVNLVVCAIAFVLPDIDRRVDLFTKEWPPGSQDGLICFCLGVETRRRKKVAGNVFSDKIVVGNVGVKRTDQVVSVAPCVGDSEITLVAPRFRITNEIHPVARPPFAIVWRGK